MFLPQRVGGGREGRAGECAVRVMWRKGEKRKKRVVRVVELAEVLGGCCGVGAGCGGRQGKGSTGSPQAAKTTLVRLFMSFHCQAESVGEVT